jgi:Mg-chelatase subunit ChlD
MRAVRRSRPRQRGSVFILYTLALGLVTLPLTGLAIDMGVLYIVQARLSAGVDGAALGVGRLLGSAKEDQYPVIAAEFLQASFPAGFWHTQSLASSAAPDCAADFNSVTLPVNSYSARHCIPSIGSHVVDVGASVNVPLIFLRILGVDHATVNAHGQATRRDSRTILVLDHSGSMNNPTGANSAWNKLKGAAITFLSNPAYFKPGYDRVGVVVFGTTAVVAYPFLSSSGYTRPYSANVNTGGSGPDVNFVSPSDVKKDGTEATNDALYMIAQTQVGGGTSMGEALWLAYVELQKGHMTDLKSGPDNRLNAIILFTDGFPNTFPVYLNNPVNTAANMLRPGVCAAGKDLATCCSCTYNPARSTAVANAIAANAAQQMIGEMGASYYPAGYAYWPAALPKTSQYPPFKMWSTDTGTTLSWVQAGDNRSSAQVDTTTGAYGGCKGMFGTNQNTPPSGTGYVRFNDIPIIPTLDTYGNSATGTDYQYSTIKASGGTLIDLYKPGVELATNNAKLLYDYPWALAAWNQTDDAGYRIRSDAGQPDRGGDPRIFPTIYTIGYQGNGGVDEALLTRLANVSTAPPDGYYTTNVGLGQKKGLYVAAYAGDDIYSAFEQVASDMLRLAQ